MKQLRSNFVQLVEMLADGKYHDGTTIGKQLNLTRAAVWKLMKKLEQYNIAILSTKGKGYKLQQPLSLLNRKHIQKDLKHKDVKVEVLERVGSTNDHLKLYTKQNTTMRACLVELQTAAKGRLDRKWHSPFAQNLYFSFLYPFKKDISELSGLSLVVALAACQAIENVADLGKHKLEVKWPNDILVDGKKLAGILIEIEAESNGQCQLIIGIGVNTNMQQATKKEVDKPWVSLAQLTGHYIDRNQLGAALIDNLIDYLENFTQHGLSHFIKEWKQRDSLHGKTVTVQSFNQSVTGQCVGIGKYGHLKLKLDSGETVELSSGDTTLAK